MVGEQLALLVEPVGIDDLSCVPNVFVQYLTFSREQCIVDGLLRQHVLEGILPLRCQTRRIEKLQLLELQQYAIQGGLPLYHLGQQGVAEHAPHH